MPGEMECGCSSDACDYDGEPLRVVEVPKIIQTLKDHECWECQRTIKRGEEAEHMAFKEDYEEVTSHVYTCSQCLAIIRDYLCGCRLYGGVREQIRAELGVDIVTGKTASEDSEPPYDDDPNFTWD